MTATRAEATRPVIGLSTYREQAAWTVWQMPADLLPAVYTRSVEAAGAIVVLLPPQADGAAQLISRLDGLIVTGGSDVDPERYGQRPDPRTVRVRRDRDAWEIALLDAADDARPADAGHLPRHAADGGAGRRGAGAAPARRGRARRARARLELVRLDRDPDREELPGPAAGRGQPAGELPSPPGRRRSTRVSWSPPVRPTGPSRRWRIRIGPSGSACSGTRRAATTTVCSSAWSKRQQPQASTPDPSYSDLQRLSRP